MITIDQQIDDAMQRIGEKIDNAVNRDVVTDSYLMRGDIYDF